MDTAALTARSQAAVGGGGGQDGRRHRRGGRRRVSPAPPLKEPLHGFLGRASPWCPADLVDFPGMPPTCWRSSARPSQDARRRSRGVCAIPRSPAWFAANLQAAGRRHLALFQERAAAPTHEAYLFAIAEAMRTVLVARQLRSCRSSSPDLGWAGTSSSPTSTSRASRWPSWRHDALSGVPPEQIRMHVCWGGFEGASTCRCVWCWPRTAVLLRRRRSPAWLRVGVGRCRPLEGKTVRPGRDRLDEPTSSTSVLVAERITRYAKLVGRESVMDCGFGRGRAGMRSDIVWAKLGALAEGARLSPRTAHLRPHLSPHLVG